MSRSIISATPSEIVLCLQSMFCAPSGSFRVGRVFSERRVVLSMGQVWQADVKSKRQ